MILLTRPRILFWVLLQGPIILGFSWWPPYEADEFHQETDIFWTLQKESLLWVRAKLPYDLISCSGSSCRKVATIRGSEEREEELPVRKGVSLTRMSETSIWVTGQSGRVYERFWNGVRWVTAPHDLPVEAGRAVGIFLLSRSVFALSQAGKLYKLQMGEDNLPSWVETLPSFEGNEKSKSMGQLKFGVASHDQERLHFSTTNGILLEFTESQEIRWHDHGKPTGGDVVSITDASSIQWGMVFTISSTGELYQFSKNVKPSWRKHVGMESRNIPLMPSKGCILNNLVGDYSSSLFLLTKEGLLMERQLYQRKWKWVMHGNPESQRLTSIMQLHEMEDSVSSLFFTTAKGHVFEYLPSNMGERWIDHGHPRHAKVARDISGIHLQLGKLIFPLDDGRLGELRMLSKRRKALEKHEWSILEVPETEGWNAEYCTEERGMRNCMAGHDHDDDRMMMMMKRKKTHECTSYVPVTAQERLPTENFQSEKNMIRSWFQLRAMHEDESFSLTISGLIFEYVYKEDIWVWLRHKEMMPIEGVLGRYNGSIFAVDESRSLLMMERDDKEISMTNCTDMDKGRKVIAGSPWDDAHGNPWRMTDDDALFFVGEEGSLLQFKVAYQRFKWKDCHHPSGTRIAIIADQEVLRMNIVFVIGEDGILYQYNRVTKLWHRHCQSPHMILKKSPAATIRKSFESLSGSLFMILENGGLVEYEWSSEDGWRWIEHGTPTRNVTFVGAPGASTSGNHVFLVGSDGKVYSRYMDQRTWKWNNHGFPNTETVKLQEIIIDKGADREVEEREIELRICDEKVAAVKPIRFSEDSTIFKLRDGRLAELRRSGGATGDWEWSQIIGTPTSQCVSGHWTSLDS